MRIVEHIEYRYVLQTFIQLGSAVETYALVLLIFVIFVKKELVFLELNNVAGGKRIGYSKEDRGVII